MSNYLHVWDRKSPRHKWRPVGCSTAEKRWHGLWMILHAVHTVQNWDAWPKGQVAWTRSSNVYAGYDLPSNAPVNVIYSKV
jgi:hypothetical protein